MSVLIKFIGKEGSGKTLLSTFVQDSLSKNPNLKMETFRYLRKGCAEDAENVDSIRVDIEDFEKFIAFNKEEYASEDVRNTIENIEIWAVDRNLIEGSTPQSQMLKMTEEVGELANAVARKNKLNARDAIGDCIVVLTILAAQLGLELEDCVNSAYDEIKDRKGQMVDGIFVKEEEEE